MEEAAGLAGEAIGRGLHAWSGAWAAEPRGVGEQDSGGCRWVPGSVLWLCSPWPTVPANPSLTLVCSAKGREGPGPLELPSGDMPHRLSRFGPKRIRAQGSPSASEVHEMAVCLLSVPQLD